MNHVLRVFLIIGIALYFVIIFYFLRQKALTLKYSLLWLATGVVMMAVAIFPAIMEWVAERLGIASVANAVFALELFFQMVILMSITSIVSKQGEKNKRLIQELGCLEKRVRELENSKDKEQNSM